MLRTKGMASVFGLAMLAAAVVAVTVFTVRLAQPGSAEAQSGRLCSVEKIAGSWLFATQVGHFPGEPFFADITALGTMNIDRDGSLSGEFDANVSEFDLFPLLGVTYWGSVSVDPDCTGTLTFSTSTGSTRTDSIAVLSNNEMWGMSLDPGNLWTYEVRRIPGQSR